MVKHRCRLFANLSHKISEMSLREVVHHFIRNSRIYALNLGFYIIGQPHICKSRKDLTLAVLQRIVFLAEALNSRAIVALRGGVDRKFR